MSEKEKEATGFRLRTSLGSSYPGRFVFDSLMEPQAFIATKAFLMTMAKTTSETLSKKVRENIEELRGKGRSRQTEGKYKKKAKKKNKLTF